MLWHTEHEISFQKAYKSLKISGRNFFKALASPWELMDTKAVEAVA